MSRRWCSGISMIHNSKNNYSEDGNQGSLVGQAHRVNKSAFGAWRPPWSNEDWVKTSSVAREVPILLPPVENLYQSLLRYTNSILDAVLIHLRKNYYSKGSKISFLSSRSTGSSSMLLIHHIKTNYLVKTNQFLVFIPIIHHRGGLSLEYLTVTGRVIRCMFRKRMSIYILHKNREKTKSYKFLEIQLK